jgi:hypothetical protein
MPLRMLSVAWMQRCKDKYIVTLRYMIEKVSMAGASAPGSFFEENVTQSSKIDNYLSILMG